MKHFFPACLVTIILFFAYNFVSVANTLHPDFPRTIIVKGDHYYPPFEFINKQGKPDGFNVELFNALAREMNLDYHLELGPWSEVMEELENGQIDVLLGLMISPQRARKMRFSLPHSVMTHGIFTLKNSPIKTLEDLRDKEIIVQQSDRMHEYLVETGLTKNIITVSSQRMALTLLNQGHHDAALIGNFQGLHLIQQYKLENIELRHSGIQPQRYAMAVNIENQQLLEIINSGLYQLKASGEYDQLYEKWFAVYEQTDFFRRNIQWVVGAILFIITLVVFIALLRYRIYKTTKHLQESEARYRSIFQNHHTIMMLIDPQSGSIADCNPAAEQFYGWSHKQLTSMNINQINTLTKEEIRVELERARQNKKNHYQFRHRRASGIITDVEVHSGTIILQKKELLYSIIYDITEKIKAQKETSNWQNLLQYVIIHAPIAIAVQDKELRYVYVSDHFLKDFGINRQDILGKTPFEVLPDLESKWREIYKRALQGEAIKSEEDQVIRHDGSKELIRWECRPWYESEGSVGGIVLYSEVITARKNAEELRYNLELARKTTQIKQTFLANISHEMRTPLNGIMGLSNYLSKTSLTEEQEKHLKIITESSQSLLQLINQVLNLSRIESQQMAIDLEEIETIALAEKLNNAFSFPFNEKGIQYSIEIADDFPPTFVYNEGLIIQVLTNLIGNALKFTEQGKVRLLFEKRINARKQLELVVSVEDSGSGIHKDHHENIFLEFIQVHDSNQLNLSGTGLGLAISKKIVESLGGEIGLESKPGKGSTFWFTIIPQKTRLTSPVKKETPTQSLLPLDLSVLLVEDKKVNRIVAELILEEMGCEVHIAENGLIALGKVKQNTYDVILMDIQMPVMDGVTAMKELRAMKKDIPPIIGLSAQAMEGDAERYIAMGMDDYLTKPIDAKLLYQKLCMLKEKLELG